MGLAKKEKVCTVLTVPIVFVFARRLCSVSEHYGCSSLIGLYRGTEIAKVRGSPIMGDISYILFDVCPSYMLSRLMRGKVGTALTEVAYQIA